MKRKEGPDMAITENPLVSVLLCVFNGERYLEEALDSIAGQTYSHWECIIIDDCSTDKTSEILAKYAQKDQRFRVFRNEKNLRLPSSLNRGLNFVKGEYVLRMDADDISRPDRMEKQVAFMQQHPEIAVAGSKVFLWREGETVARLDLRRTDMPSVQSRFIFFNPIVHPSIIARTQLIKSIGYDPAFTCTEDLNLWVQMLCKGMKIAILDDYLLLYRIHANQITATSLQKQKVEYRRIIQNFYQKTLFALDDEELDFLTNGIYFREKPHSGRFCCFYRKILRSNRKKHIFSPEAIAFGALEVLLAYRHNNADGIHPLAALFTIFSPMWIAREFAYRKRETVRQAQICQQAAEKFGLELKRREGKYGYAVYQKP